MDYKYLKHLAKRGASYIHPRGYEATKMLIDNLNIKSGERILEFGCGTGATLCKIASEYDVIIEAVDTLDEMIESANKRIKSCGFGNKLHVSKISKDDSMEFEISSFDKAYAESVLGFQRAVDLKKILSDIFRVLKSEGVFIINDAFWLDGIADDAAAKISEKLINRFGMSFASPDNISLKKFIKMAEETGFKLNETLNVDSSIKMNIDNNSVFNRKLISVRYAFDELKFRFRMYQNSKFNNLVESYLVVLNK